MNQDCVECLKDESGPLRTEFGTDLVETTVRNMETQECVAQGPMCEGHRRMYQEPGSGYEVYLNPGVAATVDVAYEDVLTGGLFYIEENRETRHYKNLGGGWVRLTGIRYFTPECRWVERNEEFRMGERVRVATLPSVCKGQTNPL